MKLLRQRPSIRRLAAREEGFTLVESVVALAVIFVSLMGLVYTATIGFGDVALARQRQTANQTANRVLEQVRGLAYASITQGLSSSDLSGDPEIVTCVDGRYLSACPSANPNAEKIVHTDGLPSGSVLVPHVATLGPPEFPQTFTRKVYVTTAKNVPASGALRVTVIVSFAATARKASSTVRTQTLVYQPQGSTDTSTAPNPGGSQAFFYGTGSQSKGSVVVTPNAGVSGGTGVKGLGAFEQVAQDLPGLDANVQQQQLVKADGQATLVGSRVTVAGVETIAGGTNAASSADDDPTTPAISALHSPGALYQAAPVTSISGGGNALEAGVHDEWTPGGAGVECPTWQPNVRWMSGFEHGRGSSLMGTGDGGGGFFFGSTGNMSMDGTLARTGTYSLRAAPAGNVTFAYYVGPTNNQVSVAHFALRLASLPTADVSQLYSARLSSTTSYAVALGYQQSTGRFTVRLRNGTGVWQAPVVSLGAVAAGQWYAVDLRWNTSGTTHTADWRIDGTAQSQASLTGAAAANQYMYKFGTESTETFAANYDDVLFSYTSADYPIPDGQIKLLRPDGMGTSNIGTAIKNEALGTTDVATWWQKQDEIPPSNADWIQQTVASTTSYAEFTLQDTADTCIRAVEALVFSAGAGSNKTNNGQMHLVHGGVDSTAWNSNLGPNLGDATSVHGMGAVVPSAGATWTGTELNGSRVRVGYSNDASPVATFHAATVQYYVPSTGGGGTPVPIPAAPQNGSTVSSVPPTAPGLCYPTQTVGACSYAREQHATSPPSLQTRVDLTGAGAGKCSLYKHASPLSFLSYALGQRSGSGVGTVREEVVRYPGTHTIGQLCSGAGSGPSGWPGYLVRYDAGVNSATARAEAGPASSFPVASTAGTITYWNGSGMASMAPPAAGGTIPVGSLDYTSSGWRTEITASLATAPSSVTQTPANAPMSGTADRTESRSVSGSPVSGTMTYRVTNTTTSEIVVDLTVAIDLGTLTAQARYQPGM